MPPYLSRDGRRSISKGPFAALSNPGFTLVELLVVIAITGVVASLLLSGLARVKERTASVVCRNHLRQWGLATQLYANDHADLLPPEGNPNPTGGSTNLGWYIQLPIQLDLPRYHAMAWRTNPAAPVGGSVWICPANRRRSNGRNLFHYCLNQHLDGTSDREEPVRMASVAAPAESVWMFDSKNLPAVGYWGFVHTNLHQGGAQFLFLDGHTTRLRNIEYWDFAANKGKTNHPLLRWMP